MRSEEDTTNYEIGRESVLLIATICEGQFGDVYKQVWTDQLGCILVCRIKRDCELGR